MGHYSRVSVPAGDAVDQLFKAIKITKVALAQRLGVSHIAFQQWRRRGATTTAAVVLPMLAHESIPLDEAALASRIDAWRDSAHAAGYDEDRTLEIVEEVAKAAADGAPFEVSTGAAMPAEQFGAGMIGLGLDDVALADEVGFAPVSIRRWAEGQNPVDPLVGFWVRRRAAARMADLGDGADPAARAMGDLLLDAVYGGWTLADAAKAAYRHADALRQAIATPVV